MQKGYDDLKTKANALENDADDASDETAAEFNEAAEAFEGQLEKAGDASADAWDATKDGVQEAWNNLVEAYDELKAEA
jgi:hypothetical protein